MCNECSEFEEGKAHCYAIMDERLSVVDDGGCSAGETGELRSLPLMLGVDDLISDQEQCTVNSHL